MSPDGATVAQRGFAASVQPPVVSIQPPAIGLLSWHRVTADWARGRSASPWWVQIYDLSGRAKCGSGRRIHILAGRSKTSKPPACAHGSEARMFAAGDQAGTARERSSRALFEHP